MFALRQDLGDLELQRGVWPTLHPTAATRFLADDIFRTEQDEVIAITSGPGGTAIYRDGELVSMSPYFRLTGKDLSGQLVIGTSPVSHHGWAGQFRRLAVYDRELGAPDVRRQYQAWTAERGTPAAGEAGLVALYSFDHAAGNGLGNLIIPGNYTVLDPPLLQRPWYAYRPGSAYWKDVVINVAGFIPFGFLVCAYRAQTHPIGEAALAAIGAGTIVSLVIEILQVHLPTRDSDLTDVITNIVGTVFGVLLFCSIRHWLRPRMFQESSMMV